jgi:hypothetical protein
VACLVQKELHTNFGGLHCSGNISYTSCSVCKILKPYECFLWYTSFFIGKCPMAQPDGSFSFTCERSDRVYDSIHKLTLFDFVSSHAGHGSK